jgi:hypothetical protein
MSLNSVLGSFFSHSTRNAVRTNKVDRFHLYSIQFIIHISFCKTYLLDKNCKISIKYKKGKAVKKSDERDEMRESDENE